jgi:tryptophan-rich sensory protein
MKRLRLLQLFFIIFVCQAAGLIGSIFTFSAISTWYTGLNKPFFSPPNWIFGPVWIILYTMMGISAYLVWQRGVKKVPVSQALNIFALQLILNALWSIIFFGMKSPPAAFLEILILWVFIVKTIQRFSKLSQTAAYLLYPYLAWVSFATVLNLAIVILN